MTEPSGSTSRLPGVDDVAGPRRARKGPLIAGLAVLGLVAAVVIVPMLGDDDPTTQPSVSPSATAPQSTKPSAAAGAPLPIGVGYQVNAEVAASEMGIDAPKVDEKEQAQAVIDAINTEGGVGGRPIAPEWYAVDAAKSGPERMTKACAKFTQDVKVFGVVLSSPFISSCLAKAKIPVIASTLVDSEAEYAKNADYYYGPSGMTTERQLRMYVDGLAEGGFFGRLPADPGCSASGPKIGIVSFDALKKTLPATVDAALAAHDLKVAQWGWVSSTSGNISQIALAFKDACVTHILAPNYNPILVANASLSQKYAPLWGITSAQFPAVLVANIDAALLPNFTLVSWNPWDETAAAGIDGDNATRCQKIMADAGLSTDPGMMETAYALCDGFFVLQRSLQGASEVSVAALRQGYEAIGDWDSPVTFLAELGPDHHAGAIGYRLAGYDPAKKGFAYTGEVHSVE